LKIVAGNPGCRPLNKHEPQPPRARLAPPAYLTPVGKTAWRKMAALIDRMGILTEVDAPALESLCEVYAELRSARATIAAAGGQLTYETTNQAGGVMIRARPEMALIADADRRFAMWCARFGLTPADRSRVSARLSEDSNPFGEFGT
jgi:P27 family predicted phage terminase small subunit